ncbi:MAG: bifunctional 5,10-methylenetetrahydrofolate dehydrogenase/5,10-methenyltetrahydrofolate cyclohydrolase [Patescibacteria group bacterium]
MIIDGKAIAEGISAELQKEITTLSRPPRLTVFTCAPNFETQKFLSLKQKRAVEVGITVDVISLDPEMVTVAVIAAIHDVISQTDGIVVQLPFPPSIDIAAVLNAIPSTHDVDALHYKGQNTTILPPVVGAIDSIARIHQVVWAHKKVAVVGKGRLVGAPAALYAKSKQAQVTVVEKDSPDTERTLREADILILGTGVPGLVTPTMIKAGAIVFDAGTSEEGGMLVGDATPEVAEKAALLTPVPGGIGPITIAVLLKNVLQLAILHSKEGSDVL